MLINLNEVRSGDKVDFSISKEHLDIDELDGSVKGSFILTKSKRRIRIKGEINFKYNITCARCLEESTMEFEAPTEGIFEQGNLHFTKGQEVELSADDSCTYYYNGDQIDVNQLIRDTIILRIPIKPLCKPDCKGLCPLCGKNLNEGDCKCQK